jgi:hypothetical protein
MSQENVSGMCAYMASAKKHARSVGGALYVSTTTIVDFVGNATEHLYVCMVCRNLDVACANHKCLVAISKLMFPLHYIDTWCWLIVNNA